MGTNEIRGDWSDKISRRCRDGIVSWFFIHFIKVYVPSGGYFLSAPGVFYYARRVGYSSFPNAVVEQPSVVQPLIVSWIDVHNGEPGSSCFGRWRGQVLTELSDKRRLSFSVISETVKAISHHHLAHILSEKIKIPRTSIWPASLHTGMKCARVN